ncbi:double zinc ribbon domain-containing protein [Dongia sp.]|uniref:double zinc ribbon domain-containing protein n=1 Tax=Dongia sp. TaxID=1977262 RepID=UPI0035AEC69F
MALSPPITTRLPRPIRHLWHRALDTVLPARCLKCGEVVSTASAGLCPTCWGALSFLGEPCCSCCGHPFEFDLGVDALCAACLESPPPFDRARAVLRYDEASRDLILAFKHADRTALAPSFAAWAQRAGRDLIADCDLIAPVPLHWSRLFARRYNQAALLANALGKATGKPTAPDLLLRRRATVRQGHLGRLARARNVAGAFALNPKRADMLAGRKVLLVDDVVTTGATISQCAAALRRGGAAAVHVLAVARVIQSA